MNRKNENTFFPEGSGLLLEGKKNMMDGIETKISIVNTKLENLAKAKAKTPGSTAKVLALQNEVRRIRERMEILKQKKRREIERKELEDIAVRLSQIPSEMEKITQEVLKQDTVNKDVAAILIQALELAEKADKLEQEYIKTKKTEEKARIESQVKVKSEKTVYYDPSKADEVNDTVKQVQQIIKDRFGSIKRISSLPQYKEFDKFGADGKFGSRTNKMVKILQKGLGYEDLTGNISPKFVREIQTEKIVESAGSYRTIYKFSDFKTLFEDFDVNLAVKYAEEDPSYSSSYYKIPAPKDNLSARDYESPKVSSSFADKSADEKWMWMQEKAEELKNKGNDVSFDEYKGTPIIRIFWKTINWKGKYPLQTVCWKNAPDEKKFGFYRDYAKINQEWKEVERGLWGEGVNPKNSEKLWLPQDTSPGEKLMKSLEGGKKSSDSEIKSIAKAIISSTHGLGTYVDDFTKAIKRIQSKGDFDAIDDLLAKSLQLYNRRGDAGTKTNELANLLGYNLSKETPLVSEYNSIQNTINGELGYRDGLAVDAIVNHLNSKGIKCSAEFEKSKTGWKGRWVEDTFKLG